MAKLTESKIFYIQAFTILALVCLPGNIFTAVMLYIQHFSSGESLPTTGSNSTELNTRNENQSLEAVFENETLFSSVNVVAKSQELVEGPRCEFHQHFTSSFLYEMFFHVSNFE